MVVRGWIRTLYAGVWRDVAGAWAWFLAGLAGIVGTWLFVEWVVIMSPLAGNRPTWWVMHVGYFFLTAIPEAALIRLGYNMAAGRVSRSDLLPDPLTITRYVLLKFIMLPVFLAGLALLVLPGLYAGARLLFSGFCVVVEKKPVFSAIRRSWQLSGAHAGRLMMLVAGLLLINLLGLLPMGAGLLITLPLSYVVAGRAYQRLASSVA